MRKVIGAGWRRCRVHFMRNALQRVPKRAEAMVTAALRTAFDQRDAESAHAQWRQLIDVFEGSHPKLAEFVSEAEHDALAYKAYPREHCPQLHCTNPLERLNKEINRRTRVVGIFSNDAAIVRLVRAMMLEQNDAWAVTRRYMKLETIGSICVDRNIDFAKLATL